MSPDNKGRRGLRGRSGRKVPLDLKACKGPLDRRGHKAPPDLPDYKAQAVHLPQVTMDALGNNKLQQMVNRLILLQASPLDRRS
jgi:hypothetical protein